MALFVQLDVNWVDHPKLMRAGLEGAGLHATAFCLAKRMETDGWIDRMLLIRYGATDALIDRLVELRLFEVDGEAVRPWNWLDRNPSQDAIAANREAKAEAAWRGNHSRWEHDGPVESCTKCKPPAHVIARCDRTPSLSDRSPTALRSPEPESESYPETESESEASSDQVSPPPPSVAMSDDAPVVVDESDVTRIIAKATRTLAESDPSVRSVDAVLPKRRTAMLTERGDEIRSRLARGDDLDDVIAWLTANASGPVDPLFGDRIVMAPGGTVPLAQSHVARALHRDRPDDADEPPAADPMAVIAEVRALRRTKTTAGEGASA